MDAAQRAYVRVLPWKRQAAFAAALAAAEKTSSVPPAHAGNGEVIVLRLS